MGGRVGTDPRGGRAHGVSRSALWVALPSQGVIFKSLSEHYRLHELQGKNWLSLPGVGWVG